MLKIIGLTLLLSTMLYIGIRVVLWFWVTVISALFGALEDYFG